MPPPARIRTVAICCLYLVCLAVALAHTQSTAGWLVLGLAPVLWLDRHLFRLLPWAGTPRLALAILLRLAFALVAAGFLDRIGHGLVTRAEAAYVGLVFSMSLFLLEVALDLVIRLAGRPTPADRPQRLCGRNLLVMLLVLAPVALLSPLSVFHPISLRPTRTPEQLGLAYEAVWLHTADGLDLAAWLVPHPRPRGSVLYCHGHGGNRQQVLGVLRQLHDLGLNVLCFDFRGHGDSPGHTAAFGLREAPDVQAAEAFLVERYPAQPLYLFGVSYGAAVGLQALPELRHVRAAWLESGFARLSDVAQQRFAAWPAGVRSALIHGYSGIIWLDSGCCPLHANPIDSLPRCTIPLYFCHGMLDRLIPFPQAQEMYDRYQGPKECYWVAHAGHGNVGGSAAAAEYQRRLTAFFGAAGGPPGSETPACR